MSSRRNELTKLGKGNNLNASRPLTEQQVNHLHDPGYFGIENLQRATNEARQLKFGDIKHDNEFESGSEYLAWV